MPIRFEHPTTEHTVTVTIQPGAFVISPCFGESYSFDRAGRLLSAFVDGQSLQRTLDHRMLIRQKDRAARRQQLDDIQQARILTHIFYTLHDLAAIVPHTALPESQKTQMRNALATVLTMPPDALVEDGDTYQRLHLPVSILPPDQYLALVLQATEGCSWNKCTFCGLYRDRDFRVRSVDEFRAHCEAVREFFGDGLSLRRGIFLADANALNIPQQRLVDLINTAHDVFSTHGEPKKLYSFISAFDSRRKSADNWQQLRQLGLSRVYIGLETGDDDLLDFVNKPGTAQDAIQAVNAIKESGIAVGIIVMVGLGGRQYAEQHVANTLNVIEAMQLNHDDLIYLSPYRPAPNTEYPQQMIDAGIKVLTPEEESAQFSTFKSALNAIFPRVRATKYLVDGFAL